MAPPPLFAGIDSGTQSTKVLIVDEDGKVHGRGQAAYGLIEGLPPGHKEQHPDTWIAGLRAAWKEAVAGLDASRIVAIGVSGQQHGFVPLAEDGSVIRPAKLWCDTATAAEAQEIMDALGGLEGFLELTGNALPPGFTASKILWLKRHEPESFARLTTVLLPHDYLNYWLTGRLRMEWGDASGTGLMDVRTRTWCGEVAAAIDGALAEKLPPLAPSTEPCGTVRAGIAKELGVATECLVSAGGGDNMMGAIGTGNVREGTVTASLGTSGTVHAWSAGPVIDKLHGEIAAFCDSTGAWLPLLCTMNVTVATELVKRTFGLDTEQLNEAAASMTAGAEGLMLLPYFEGERVPNVPEGSGVWFGYRERTHTAAHFARAAMEGAVLGMAYGLQRMRQLGLEPREIRLTGGGSRSAVWRQILADAFAAPAVCTNEAEGAALGAALQAAAAHADIPVRDVCARAVKLDEATRVKPGPANARLYERLLAIHEELSGSLRPAFHHHAALFGQDAG